MLLENLVLNFNSIKVRLKLYTDAFGEQSLYL